MGAGIPEKFHVSFLLRDVTMFAAVKSVVPKRSSVMMKIVASQRGRTALIVIVPRHPSKDARGKKSKLTDVETAVKSIATYPLPSW